MKNKLLALHLSCSGKNRVQLKTLIPAVNVSVAIEHWPDSPRNWFLF
jgi:hypothetical protein